MSHIYDDLIKLLKDRKKAVLARIIRQEGSAPRSLGTACFFLEDGSLAGTIGGGLLEYQAQQKALEVFKSGKSALFQMQLTGKDVEDTNMICGGIVDIFLEPFFPKNPASLEVLEAIQNLLRTGKKGILLTWISEGLGAGYKKSRALITKDGKIAGDLSDILQGNQMDIDKLTDTNSPVLIDLKDGERKKFVFVEPIIPDAVLYLFGAGHVSTYVAPLAHLVGFKVCVIDDRDEFANAKRFPVADEIMVCSFADAFERLTLHASSYVTIVTRGHRYDRDVLRSALREETAYIGMIGSRRKRDKIYESLMNEGVTKEAIDKVHSPIGLPIGAETPEEIAISIVAELVQARAGK